VEEIKPLVELCKGGKLFAVQEWVAAGKPVNLPPRAGGRAAAKAPLQVAMDLGFHSLTEVLLKAGATAAGGRGDDPMEVAIGRRRFDLVELLVENGYDPAAVDMRRVFDTWDPALMEFFIERGADVESGNPLAYALCHRVRTALAVFKRNRERFPGFPEQANIALRHHCVAGDLKWVSLLLWAGADPYAPGVHEYDRDPHPDDPGSTALELAALYDHFEVLGLKQARLDPAHPATTGIVRWACKEKGLDLVKRLLDRGWNPNDQANGGSSVIPYLLRDLGWEARFRARTGYFDYLGGGSSESRVKLRAVQMLVGGADGGSRRTPGRSPTSGGRCSRSPPSTRPNSC
jgi:ankyrin repeat protein